MVKSNMVTAQVGIENIANFGVCVLVYTKLMPLPRIEPNILPFTDHLCLCLS